MIPLDEEEGPWGVYELFCRECGRKIIHVATVAAVEGGYADAFEDPPICSLCEYHQRNGSN